MMTASTGSDSMMASIGPEELLERQFHDQVATATIQYLHELGFLPPGLPFDAVRFHDAYEQVQRTFTVPESSITTLMARLLFGIADRLRPTSVLAIGAAAGNALVWLAAPLRVHDRVIGVDNDDEVVALARRNFDALGLQQVKLLTLDGHLASGVVDGPYDLVLLDADDPVRRKQVYLTLLDGLESGLRPGSIILAHDVCYAAFQAQLIPYLNRIRDPDRYQATITLAIDSYGLEVTLR